MTTHANNADIGDEIMNFMDRLRTACDSRIKAGAVSLDMAELLTEVGSPLTGQNLADLQIPTEIQIQSGAWTDWFPWRTLYSQLWKQTAPNTFAAHAYLQELSDSTNKLDSDDDEMLVMP